MKLSHFLCCLIFLEFLTSCQSNCEYCDEVICETIHRYGVPLEPEDWAARGQDGQVISMRKDGVSVMRSFQGGILHGECTYSFPYRNVVQQKEIYDRGTLVQEFSYYPSGLPLKHVIYEEPSHQFITSWYENGAPYSREEIQDNYLQKGEYYTLEQDLESSVEGGSGVRTCRDGLGQLQGIDAIEEGRLALRTTYHPSGSPASVTPYLDNKIEGERRTYFSQGEPATIEKWKGNSQHGMTIQFEHGEKYAEIPYVKGSKHGIERRYCNDGRTLTQEISWVRGKKHGLSTSFIGQTSRSEWYFQDQLVPNKATFDMLSQQ